MTQENESQNTSVPWTGFDVLLFFALWLTPFLISVVVSPPHVPVTEEVAENHGHPIAQLVIQCKNSPIIFLVIFLSAVVAVPLLEEFLFRMLLQGYIEAKFKQCQLPYASGMAIAIVSCFFAAMHMGDHKVIDADALLIGTIASIVFCLSIFLMGIGYLAWVKNARIADYLFGTKWFFHPKLITYTGLCLLTLLFCFALNAILSNVFEGTNISPIPIFFFSLVLGIIYSRTQNLSYCILLHACLNGISLVALWFVSGV